MVHGNVCGDAERAFAEDQGRYVVTAPAGTLDGQEGVHPVGRTGGDSLILVSGKVSLADLRVAHEGFFPRLMGADSALA